MSEVLLLTIGAIIFAVTTSATVMVGGLMMSRVTERDRRDNLPPAGPVTEVRPAA